MTVEAPVAVNVTCFKQQFVSILCVFGTLRVMKLLSILVELLLARGCLARASLLPSRWLDSESALRACRLLEHVIPVQRIAPEFDWVLREGVAAQRQAVLHDRSRSQAT